MRTFDLIAILIVVAALFSYINFKVLKLPSAIGLMTLTLAFSVTVFIVGHASPAAGAWIDGLMSRVDLNEALLHGMLGFLLFAGALHVDLGDLARNRWPIAALSTFGVLISTAVVGVLTWGLLVLIGLPIRFIDCLLFGALISPTDPIAVLGLLKRVGVPKTLEVQIAGESLFNDGVGVVVFTGLLGIAAGIHAPDDVGHVASLFAQETLGGALFGLIAGFLVFLMLRSVDDYKVEVLLSLGLVAGGYALADAWHLSAPIAMVVAGLMIGNHGRTFAMSETTNERLDMFWELIDEALNAVLFVLIGLEVLLLSFTPKTLVAGLLVVPIVLAARAVSVALPVRVLRRRVRFEPSTVRILTWGGLRGGISVALALSIPGGASPYAVPGRDVILVITYVVVIFSILVQGLTVGPLTQRWLSETGEPASLITIDDDGAVPAQELG
ncbi:cation:proton antiporter [Paludisphaera rhizosphaerae]|uniref:cation:proton antiporter n=1 Tax=Paludisphaera rhizosphaerae TaxID=2711216 RepID=UPI0013ECA91E|nr:sodium:proton antiporter [Paludisphaera rhizosphaerae]